MKLSPKFRRSARLVPIIAGLAVTVFASSSASATSLHPHTVPACTSTVYGLTVTNGSSTALNVVAPAGRLRTLAGGPAPAILPAYSPVQNFTVSGSSDLTVTLVTPPTVTPTFQFSLQFVNAKWQTPTQSTSGLVQGRIGICQKSGVALNNEVLTIKDPVTAVSPFPFDVRDPATWPIGSTVPDSGGRVTAAPASCAPRPAFGAAGHYVDPPTCRADIWGSISAPLRYGLLDQSFSGLWTLGGTNTPARFAPSTRCAIVYFGNPVFVNCDVA